MIIRMDFADFESDFAMFRMDFGELAPAVFNGGKTVIFQGRVARTGSHKYPWGIERRDGRELDKIVRQLPGLPVVLHHPPKLLKEGANAEIIGRVDRAWRDGDYAHASIRVDSEKAIREIRNGVNQLSLGYGLESIVNEWQRGTTLDHLAFVTAARCGSACSVRLDSADCCEACRARHESSGRSAVRTMNIRRIRAAEQLKG